LESNPIKEVVAIILWQEKMNDPKINLENSKNKLIELLTKEKFEEICKDIRENDTSLLATTELFYSDNEVSDDIVEDIISNIKNHILISKREGLRNDLKKAESENDTKLVDEILKKIQDISGKIG